MKRILIFLIDVYRVGISPYFPPSCRYQPTCSSYAKEALEKHGVLKGCWLAAGRIASCHPWSKGGYDPVPGTAEEKAGDETSGKEKENVKPKHQHNP
jgi:putative membrane protein insertion efficiency factor